MYFNGKLKLKNWKGIGIGVSKEEFVSSKQFHDLKIKSHVHNSYRIFTEWTRMRMINQMDLNFQREIN